MTAKQKEAQRIAQQKLEAMKAQGFLQFKSFPY